jgi:4a-hydroxytetrahydrobiopterin dehydratase
MNPLPEGWYHSEIGITTAIRFPSFSEAFSFLTQVALASEKYDHHPNVNYREEYVLMYLFSYNENKITEKDYQFAEVVNKILRGYPNARIQTQN